MCFLFGGLRFREQVNISSGHFKFDELMKYQIYNSTVTQMSACLLSLSVMSLLLPVSLSLLPQSISCLMNQRLLSTHRSPIVLQRMQQY